MKHLQQDQVVSPAVLWEQTTGLALPAVALAPVQVYSLILPAPTWCLHLHAPRRFPVCMNLFATCKPALSGQEQL